MQYNKIQQNHPQKIIFLDVDGVLTHEDYLNGVEEDLDETKSVLPGINSFITLRLTIA